MKTNFTTIIIIVAAFICSTSDLKADHLQRGYISYQYVDSNKYLVTVTLHRDCYGILAPSYVTVCYSSAISNVNGTINLNPVAGTGNVVPRTNCAVIPGNCASGVGVEEWVYSDTLLLPVPVTDWVLNYNIYGFFGSSSFPPPSSYDGYVRATLNSIDFPDNSTPVFNDTIFDTFCINYYTTMNYSCTDGDGDSLVFSLIGGIIGSDSCPPALTPYVYFPPYSPTNPVMSSIPVTLNSATGLLEFVPNVLQVVKICIKIDEYRNGIFVGSSTRDDQIIVRVGPASGINEHDKISVLALFPNPTTNLLHLKLTKLLPPNTTITITDMQGRVVKEVSKITPGGDAIDVSKLTQGVYLLKVNGQVQRFVKI